MLSSTEADNTKARPGKRKPVDSSEPFIDLKKARLKEPATKPKASKRPTVKGEQQRDGLIIFRPPVNENRGELPQLTASEHCSNPSPTRDPTDPPYRKAPTPLPEDIQADEDVRRMDEEARHLKTISINRAHTASSSGLNLKFGDASTSSAVYDSVQSSAVPLLVAETPVHQKNKQLRDRLNHSGGPKRRLRRSSSSMGNSGVITNPHPSVPVSNFYKHLDPTLPDAVRMRHLLVWCANRAKSSTSKTQSSSGIPLPPLSQQGAQVVQDVQTRLIQLLAEGKISTPVSSESLNANAPANLKEHPQNAKNRVQEDTLLKHLNQAKSELEAWNKTIESYNTIRVSMQESLNFQRRMDQRKQSKGKERDLLQWEPWEDEPGQNWVSAVEIAKDCLEQRANQTTSESSISPLVLQPEEIDFKVDKLCERVHLLSQSALQTARELDARFEALSLALERQARLPLSQSADPGREALRTIADTDTKRGATIERADALIEDAGSQALGGRVTPFPPTPRTPRRGTTPNR